MTGALARLVVRLSGRIVPSNRRDRWIEEWLGELAAAGAGRPILRRALGAPVDALVTRRLSHEPDGVAHRRRPLAWIPSALDVRQALRVARRTPVVTAASVLALAVGLGLTVVAWTIVRGIFHLPLPGPDGARIVRVTDYDSSGGFGLRVPIGEFRRRRGALTTFDDLGAFNERDARWDRDASARMVKAAWITPNTMRLIGVSPIAGRDLTDADSLSGGADVILVREPLAVTTFGSIEAAVGSPMAIDGRTRLIVGVIPAACRFPFISDVWIPFAPVVSHGTAPEQDVAMFGRLKEPVSQAQAAAEMDALIRSGPSRPNSDRIVSLVIPFGRPPGPPEQQYVAWAFVGAVGLLLLVATANVAHLVLARTTARREELLVRAALGASRARLALQLGLEGLVIGLLAAAAGTAGAAAALGWFRTTIPDLPYWVHFDLDPGATLVMAVLALLVSTIVGVLPALRLTGRRAGFTLTRTTAAVRFGRTSSALIAAEAAIAIGLLSGAAALGQALFRFGGYDTRLPADRVLVAQLYFGTPPDMRTPGFGDRPAAERRAAARRWDEAADVRQRALVDEVLAVAGVRGAARASDFPGNPANTAQFEIAGADPAPLTTRVIEADERYFDLLDARPVAGRTFTRQDVDRSSPVVVVNEPFVRRHFGGQPAIGRQIRRAGADGARGPWHEVVGVVADLGVNPGAPSLSDGVYLPLRATNVVRVAVRADRLDPIVAWLDERAGAGQPAADVQWTRTLREQLDEPAFLYRGVGSALTSLGLVALLLACTGIHALVSLSVNERRRELAVRVALGAGRGRIIRSILSHTGWQLLVGSAAGLLLALAVMRAVDLLPFDVDGSDPSLVALTIAVLAGAGFAACLQPLRQALAIRPVDWLRG